MHAHQQGQFQRAAETVRLPCVADVAPPYPPVMMGYFSQMWSVQDTLSNLFAGLYVAVARQIRPGDSGQAEQAWTS